jgi:hypothetical protein
LWDAIRTLFPTGKKRFYRHNIWEDRSLLNNMCKVKKTVSEGESWQGKSESGEKAMKALLSKRMMSLIDYIISSQTILTYLSNELIP